MALASQSPQESRTPARRALLLGCLAILVIGAPMLATLGGPHAFGAAVLVLCDRLLLAGLPAAAYLIAAMGFGLAIRPLLNAAADRLALQFAAGLALLLWLSHAMGWAGAFGGAHGPWVAMGVIGVGVALSTAQFVRWARSRLDGFELRTSALAPVACVGVALLVVAAANPPGWLWDSEFGAYDTLSYHLQLPQEWYAQGRLTPVHHNVYSFLPGYVEGAFLHLGTAMFPREAFRGDAWGLMANDGYGAFGAQYLVVGLTIAAAWMTGAAARRGAARAGVTHPAALELAFGIAACLVLLTPWAVVTGSLAYNDIGVPLFFGGAVLAGWNTEIPPPRRGVLVGLLVGAACSIKPTALLLVAAPIVPLLWITLPAGSRLKQGLPAALGAVFGGLVMIAPWLIRNWLESGNPVFPFASGLFANDLGGTGHWPADQVARYAAAHRFDGSLADRLRLLVIPQAPSPNTPDIARFRGMSHPQWGLFFVIVLIAGVVSVARKPLRALGLVLLGAIGIQAALWLAFTHLQSRFLLPMLAPGAVLCGVVAAHLRNAARDSGLARMTGLLAAGVCVAQGAWAVHTFSAQRRSATGAGQPNALLVGGVALRTADGVRESLEAVPREAARQWLDEAPPEAFLNAALPRDSVVYLLGDATPLYIGRRVIYNTTWDAWPIASAIRAHPNDPAAWAASLRKAGATHVLVSLSEVRRLQRSGYADPVVTEEAVQGWMVQHTRLVRAWPTLGVFLVELPAPNPGGTP